MLDGESKKPKKVLLVTVSAGEGHNSAMKTIKTKLESAGDEVKVVDVFKDHSSAFKYYLIKDMFLTLCKYFMPIYNWAFKHCQTKDPNKRNRSRVHSFLKNETASFLQDVLTFHPDVIFATHIFGAIIALNLKRTYDLPYKVVFLFTDCIVYPYAECAIYADKIITPYQALTENYLKLGYTEEQILPYGIPVKEKFYQDNQMTKSDFRKKIGLDENLFTVMLMLGGGGSSDMVRIFKETIKVTIPMQILVVCGKDEKSKKQIDKFLTKNSIRHKVVNYGFVSNIEEIMGASDLLLGKCGGLSSTEAICQALPLMITTRLPIQEVANYEFLLKHDAAVELKKGEKIAARIEECIANPSILKSIEDNLKKIKNHNILEKIYHVVDSFTTAKYTPIIDSLAERSKFRIKQDVRRMLKLVSATGLEPAETGS